MIIQTHHRLSLPKTSLYLLAALFLASCGALKETAYAPDDVYYQEESGYVREVVASAPAERNSNNTSDDSDEYYNPQEARRAERRGFYDVAYRDPYFYNYGRFGFNSGAWGMGMGNPIGAGYRPFYGSPYNGAFGTGSYWGGGSSFYGYDPFMNNNMYSSGPWMSPYNNNGWGNSWAYGGYSPNWMYPNNFYGNSFNPYMGYYDPFNGYYGNGGYCPNMFNPVVSSSAYNYGPRSSINNLSNTSAGGRPKSTLSNGGLMNDVASNISRERMRNQQNSRLDGARDNGERGYWQNNRTDNTRNNGSRTEQNRNNRTNNRLSKPSRNTRSNDRLNNTRDRSNSRGSGIGGGSNDRGGRSGGGSRSGGRR